MGQILFVTVLIGALLALVFLPLLRFAQATNDAREYRIWIAEWAGFTAGLTALLCRRELAVLLGLRPPDSKKDLLSQPFNGKN